MSSKKKRNQNSDKILQQSIEEQRKNMQEMIENQKKKKKIVVEVNDEKKNLSLEDELVLFSGEDSFSSGLQIWPFFTNLVINENSLSGMYHNEVYQVIFDDEKEKILEGKCKTCEKFFLLCHHICGLVLAFLKNPESVVDYQILKERIENCPKKILQQTLFQITNENAKFLHELNMKLNENLEKENDEKQEDSGSDTEKDEEMKDEEVFEILPIAEKIQYPINFDQVVNHMDLLIENYLDHGIYIETIEDLLTDYINIADRFFDNEKQDLSLDILITIAIPFFTASNRRNNDCFVRDSDQFEYYTLFTQICDRIEKHNLKQLNKEKKNQLASEFDNICQTIENRMDSAQKLSRITDILVSLNLSWDDPLLQDVLKGDKTAISNYKEEQRSLINRRILYMIKNGEKQQCIFYCQAVKEYYNQIKLLIELKQFDDATDLIDQDVLKDDQKETIADHLKLFLDEPTKKQNLVLFQLYLSAHKNTKLLDLSFSKFETIFKIGYKIGHHCDLLEMFKDELKYFHLKNILNWTEGDSCDFFYDFKIFDILKAQYGVDEEVYEKLIDATKEKKNKKLLFDHLSIEFDERPSLFRLIEKLEGDDEKFIPHAKKWLKFEINEEIPNIELLKFTFGLFHPNYEEPIEIVKQNFNCVVGNSDFFDDTSIPTRAFNIILAVIEIESKLIDDLIIHFLNLGTFKLFNEKSTNFAFKGPAKLGLNSFFQNPFKQEITHPYTVRNKMSIFHAILEMKNVLTIEPPKKNCFIIRKIASCSSIECHYKNIKNIMKLIFERFADEKLIKEKLKLFNYPIVQIELCKYLILKNESLDGLKLNKEGFKRICQNEFLNEEMKMEFDLLYDSYEAKINKKEISTKLTAKELAFKDNTIETAVQNFKEMRETFQSIKSALIYTFMDEIWKFYFPDGKKLAVSLTLTASVDFQLFCLMNQPTRVNLIVWSTVQDLKAFRITAEYFLKELEYFVRYGVNIDPFKNQWRVSLKLLFGWLKFEPFFTSLILSSLSKLDIQFCVEIATTRIFLLIASLKPEYYDEFISDISSLKNYHAQGKMVIEWIAFGNKIEQLFKNHELFTQVREFFAS
eukprot:gene6496-10504_t